MSTVGDVVAKLPAGLDLLGKALQAVGLVVPGVGIAGAAATGLASVIAHALGTDATPDAISAALDNLTPDQHASLLTLQETNKAQLQQAAIGRDVASMQASVALIQSDVSDRTSARQLAQSTRASLPGIIAILIIVGSVIAALGLFMGWFPAFKDVTVAGTCGTVIGYLFNEVKQITSYYFGSSAGEQRSQEIRAAATPAAIPSAADKT